MFKVICIDDDWEQSQDYECTPDIKFGQIVTVIDAFYDCGFKSDVYEFLEYPDGLYEQKGFAPISEIDETEMIREQLTETA